MPLLRFELVLSELSVKHLSSTKVRQENDRPQDIGMVMPMFIQELLKISTTRFVGTKSSRWLTLLKRKYKSLRMQRKREQ